MATESRWIASSMDEVATFFGVTPTTVRRDWKSQGMPGGRKRYPLDEIAQWRAERMQRANRQTDDNELKRREEMASVLKLETDAKLKFLNLKKAEGQVVDRSEALAEIEEIFNRVRQRLEAIPQEVGTSIPPDARSDVIADIRYKIRLALKQMESWSLDD